MMNAEELAEKINAVRSMAGSNQFSIEGCGWLAEICELARDAVEQDPFQSEDYQRFQAEVAKSCESPDAPCDGCLAGGICDGPNYPRRAFDEQDDMDRDSY